MKFAFLYSIMLFSKLWSFILMFDQIREDILSYKARDPAAATTAQILLLYPGLRATRYYRYAHKLYLKKHYFLARYLSQRAVKKTGIEIHPGAEIGRRFVIDHGTGIVIGETTVIGDDVLVYQGVTLGGTGKDKGKRHPTVGNNVMIGAGAKVLGPINIGSNTKVAAGSVVLKDTPENSTVVGIPARVVKLDGVRINDLDQINIPDPLQIESDRLREMLRQLESKIDEEHNGKKSSYQG